LYNVFTIVGSDTIVRFLQNTNLQIYNLIISKNRWEIIDIIRSRDGAPYILT